MAAQYERPSKRATTIARKKMIVTRAIVAKPPKYYGYEGAYEGDDELAQNIFNKRKFFTSLGTVRTNELCKLHRVYEKGINKAQKVERLCNLDNAEDIVFHEIYVRKYGSIDEMTQAFNQLPEKRKRGTPQKKHLDLYICPFSVYISSVMNRSNFNIAPKHNKFITVR